MRMWNLFSRSSSNGSPVDITLDLFSVICRQTFDSFRFVVGFDIDEDALEICHENVNTLEITDTVDLVQIDVTKQKMNWTENFFDVVVMNPPFGTKRNEG